MQTHVTRNLGLRRALIPYANRAAPGRPDRAVSVTGGRTNLVQRYRARLEGGPRHGRQVALRAGPLGGPPDFVAADEEGVYALAGGRAPDGRLPYWWMHWVRAEMLRRVVPQAGDAPAPPQPEGWTPTQGSPARSSRVSTMQPFDSESPQKEGAGRTGARPSQGMGWHCATTGSPTKTRLTDAADGARMGGSPALRPRVQRSGVGGPAPNMSTDDPHPLRLRHPELVFWIDVTLTVHEGR